MSNLYEKIHCQKKKLCAFEKKVEDLETKVCAITPYSFFVESATGPTGPPSYGPFEVTDEEHLRLFSTNDEIKIIEGSVIIKIPGGTGPTGLTGATGPLEISGVCYSDYLYWDGTKWQNGMEKVHLGQNAGQTLQGSKAVAIGLNAGNSNQEFDSIAIGNNAGQNNQKSQSIAIGVDSGMSNQSQYSIAIGNSVAQTDQKQLSIAIGLSAGNSTQRENSIAIGGFAGEIDQQNTSIAIGEYTGNFNQSFYAIALGNESGTSNQKNNAIAIGTASGLLNQGISAIGIGAPGGFRDQKDKAIGIGFWAGERNQSESAIEIGINNRITGQGQRTLLIGTNLQPSANRTDVILIGNQIRSNYSNHIALHMRPDTINTKKTLQDSENSLYIAPVRGVSSGLTNIKRLSYNTITKEIVYQSGIIQGTYTPTYNSSYGVADILPITYTTIGDVVEISGYVKLNLPSITGINSVFMEMNLPLVANISIPDYNYSYGFGIIDTPNTSIIGFSSTLTSNTIRWDYRRTDRVSFLANSDISQSYFNLVYYKI